MNELLKRHFKAIALIMTSVISALIVTFVYDFMVDRFGHAERFAWIFGVSGGCISIVTIVFAFIIWTNNFGEGFKNKS